MLSKKQVDNIISSFQQIVLDKLSKRLKSLYIVGSYTFGKISNDRPDINFLLIFDKFTSPQDYLTIGEICRTIEEEFSKDTTVKIEFRPFRYIKPRYQNELEVSINPIIISTGEIQGMGGVIFNKWFTEGLKNANKLLSGEDFLKALEISSITTQDLQKGAIFDLSFFSIPLSRAPAQYNKKESNLLLNESLTNAKNIAFFGIEAAMKQEELDKKAYLQYMKNKETITSFYKERYGDDVSRMVKRIFEVRTNYLKYKNDPEVAEELFGIALSLTNIIRSKILTHH